MKPYGQPKGVANRGLRGTSRPCPCCIPLESWTKMRLFKRRARREAKKEISLAW